MTIDSPQRGEARKIDIAPVGDMLLVLTLVYAARGHVVRIISFRRASRKERRLFHAYTESS